MPLSLPRPTRLQRRLRAVWYDVEDACDELAYRAASAWRQRDRHEPFGGQRSAGSGSSGDLAAGLKQGLLFGLAVLAVALPPSGIASYGRPSATHGSAQVAAAHTQTRRHVPRPADFAGQDASSDARQVADWVSDSGDNRGTPFAILDKREARLHVFDREGRLIDSSRVLLGATPGDDSADGIGTKAMSDVKQQEKTTPAGRFVSQPGTNAGGEEVIWVDYHNAVSMHRVRIVDPKERRLQRLASGDAADRRISFGCINVPVAFFDSVLKPNLGSARAVVYVLPERKALHEVFPVYALEDRYPDWRRDATGRVAINRTEPH